MSRRNLVPRPIRTWLRNRGRVRHAIDKHPIPVLTDWEKRDQLVGWARQSGVRVFVETGTYLGATTLALREIVDRCITIELDPVLHARAAELFAGRSGIELLQGDSAGLMPGILERLDEPALFWLDAHYSGHGTGRGDEDSPVIGELKAILAHKVRRHVILVDDAREFVGANGYPTVRHLTRLVESAGYHVRIRDDLIRIFAT